MRLKKSSNNVWFLAETGDKDGLVQAMKSLPSAASICGWSLSGSARRGLRFNPETSKWEVTSHPAARPGTLLHYAAVTGSIPIALVAFRFEADPTVSLGPPDPTASSSSAAAAPPPIVLARDIAKANGCDEEFLNLVELGMARQGNGQALQQHTEEEESFERSQLSANAEQAMARLLEGAKAGVVSLRVEPRGMFEANERTEANTAFSERPHLMVAVPRLSTRRDIERYILKAFGSLPPFAMSFVAAGSGNLPAAAVELHSRNVAELLAQRNPALVLRPLLDSTFPCFLPNSNTSTNTGEGNSKLSNDLSALPDESGDAVDEHQRSPNRTHNSTMNDTGDVSLILREFRQLQSRQSSSRAGSPSSTSHNQSTQNRSSSEMDQRRGIVARMREAVEQFQRTTQSPVRSQKNQSVLNASVASLSSPKKLDAEAADAMISRLYNNAMDQVTTRRKEHSDYVAEGAARLLRRTAPKVLSPEQEEAVNRLSSDEIGRRAEKLAALEETLLSTMEKPRESTLSPEDAEAARERLVQSTHSEETTEALRLKVYGPPKAVKKLSKAGWERCVASVYTQAMQKKIDAVAKSEVAYGDFRSRKAASKKLSKDEEKAVADRLSKKD